MNEGGSWAAIVVRRLLLTIPVLLGASFLIFAMVYALPGDPDPRAGRRPPARLPPSSRSSETDYNLNDPLLIQYFKYLGNLAQGDFGTDFRGRDVIDIIGQRLPGDGQADARRGVLRDRSSA